MLTLVWLPPIARLELCWLGQADETVVAPAYSAAPVVAALVGPRGPAGAGGARHVHEQTSAAAEWIVNHSFGRPTTGVRVLSPGGIEVTAGVVDVTNNQLRITFAVPAAGRAIVI